MIHKAEDGSCTISSHHAWRPGIYESERAARYAFRFDDAVLQRLQDSVNPGGAITFAMLQGAARNTVHSVSQRARICTDLSGPPIESSW